MHPKLEGSTKGNRADFQGVLTYAHGLAFDLRRTQGRWENKGRWSVADAPLVQPFWRDLFPTVQAVASPESPCALRCSPSLQRHRATCPNVTFSKSMRSKTPADHFRGITSSSAKYGDCFLGLHEHCFKFNGGQCHDESGFSAPLDFGNESPKRLQESIQSEKNESHQINEGVEYSLGITYSTLFKNSRV